MTAVLRVIDGGERSARHHVAFGRALIDRHREGAIPDTLRFGAFPPSALVARDQPLFDEVAVDWCRSQDIAVARRLGGGATVYAGPGQLGWDLVVDAARLGGGSLAEILAAAGGLVVAALDRLGVPGARFRPPGRIEREGRRVATLGGFREGGTVYLQGLLLVELEPGELTRLLTVPATRLAWRGPAQVRAGLVTLAELPGRAGMAEARRALAEAVADRLGLDPAFADADAAEEALAVRLHDEVYGRDSHVDRVAPLRGRRSGASARSEGGAVLTAHVGVSEGVAPEIVRVVFTGNHLMSPPDALDTLSGRLVGRPVEAAAALAQDFFAEAAVELLALTPADVAAALAGAIAQARARG